MPDVNGYDGSGQVVDVVSSSVAVTFANPTSVVLSITAVFVCPCTHFWWNVSDVSVARLRDIWFSGENTAVAVHRVTKGAQTGFAISCPSPTAELKLHSLTQMESDACQTGLRLTLPESLLPASAVDVRVASGVWGSNMIASVDGQGMLAKRVAQDETVSFTSVSALHVEGVTLRFNPDAGSTRSSVSYFLLVVAAALVLGLSRFLLF